MIDELGYVSDTAPIVNALKRYIVIRDDLAGSGYHIYRVVDTNTFTVVEGWMDIDDAREHATRLNSNARQE